MELKCNKRIWLRLEYKATVWAGIEGLRRRYNQSESDTQTGAKAGATTRLIDIQRQVTLFIYSQPTLAVHQNDGGHLNTSSLAQPN